jgi:hypothetical protein
MTERKIIDGDEHVMEDRDDLQTHAPWTKTGLSSGYGSPLCSQNKVSVLAFHLAAHTMISTNVPGVSSTPTAARAGKFLLSTHAIQASFISSLSVMSAR